jgi:hypothetical protein
MAGCPLGKMTRAMIAEKAMSVAHGIVIVRPLHNSAGPTVDVRAT